MIVGKNEQTFDELSDDSFSWPDYLTKTSSEAAPASCFCQHAEPPRNEFRVGHKLETYDPRNTTSTCIGTVIETMGPRVRLRLDGTDDRNDFWLMCDSDLIHPFEYSAKNGRKIAPPLGYGNDLSKWPKFLEKLIQTAGEDMFAGEQCFKKPPARPLRNEFRVGHKLEAIDPKNPPLICPATVKEIKRDKLLIAFDGWSYTSQFWCAYTSRDIFPAGWCRLAAHPIQTPPDEKPMNASKRAKKSLTLKIEEVSPQSANKQQQPQQQQQPQEQQSTPNIDKGESFTVAANSSNDTQSKTTTITVPTGDNAAMTVNESSNADTPRPQSAAATDTAATTISETITSTSATSAAASSLPLPPPPPPTPTPTPRSVAMCQPMLDLSIVKSEAMEPSEHSTPHFARHREQANDTDSNNTTSQARHNPSSSATASTSSKSKPLAPLGTTLPTAPRPQTVIVYVNPSGKCGPSIKTDKFHRAHTKFGPGTPSTIYKSVMQSFVDCANDRLDVFRLIPEGTSDEYVKLKTTNLSERKRLIKIENAKHMWASLRRFCKLLSIDDTQLFTGKSPLKNTTNNIPNGKQPQTQQQQQQRSQSSNLLTPQATSSSSSSSVSSYENGKTNGHKRPSVSSSSNHLNGASSRSSNNNNNNNNGLNNEDAECADDADHSSSSKLFRLDSLVNHDMSVVSEWTVEQVFAYITQLSDGYFASYSDKFKDHEIDGRALTLLSTEILMKYMGFKLGPALKLNNYLDKLRRATLRPEPSDAPVNSAPQAANGTEQSTQAANGN